MKGGVKEEQVIIRRVGGEGPLRIMPSIFYTNLLKK